MTAIRFVLLFGFLSLGACAVFVAVSLRNLNRKSLGFPLIDGNNVVQFSDEVGRSSLKALEPIRR
jgi:hypothetical protein